MEILYEPFKTLPLTEFRDELRFEFPNLPVPLLDHYLLRAARHMARVGNLIRRRAVIHAHHGVTRYRLQSPDGMQINAIHGIRRAPDCGCGSQSIMRSFDPPEGAFCCGREIAWYDDLENVLHVTPPYCHGSYYVSLSVLPARDACELPDKYYTDFLDTLLMGTKGGIMLITGRPWTNLALGQAYTNEFNTLISGDAIDTAAHKQRGSVKMNFGRVM